MMVLDRSILALAIAVVFHSSATVMAHTRLLQLPLIPHQSARARHLQQSNDAGAVQVGALYQGYGTHYVDLWVGSPTPQRQTLIVDTGSSLTAFPCSECTNCGADAHTDPSFDERLSATFSQVPCDSCKNSGSTCSASSDQGRCHLSTHYQDGSAFNAYEAQDVAYIGGPHDHPLLNDNHGLEDIDPNHAKAFSFEMVFGCETSNAKWFQTQLADGIMGMNQAKVSFWQQMYEANLSNPSFSLCFTRQPVANKEGTEAGAMTLGGYDERLHDSPMVYTTTSPDGGRHGQFYVQVRKVHLRDGTGGDRSGNTDMNAQVITLSSSESKVGNRVLVDSGTTDTDFTMNIAAEFKKVYKQLTGKTFRFQGVDLTLEELNSLPTILIQMVGDATLNSKVNEGAALAKNLDPDHPNDVVLAIPPSHYMEYDMSQELYYPRFYVDTHGDSVIGANALMGHDVYFDASSNRIGWAESTCDYHTLLDNNGYVDVSGSGISFKPQVSVDDEDTHHDDDDDDDICQGPYCHYLLVVAAVLIVSVAAAVYVLRQRRNYTIMPLSAIEIELADFVPVPRDSTLT